jgi:hypothetical protein
MRSSILVLLAFSSIGSSLAAGQPQTFYIGDTAAQVLPGFAHDSVITLGSPVAIDHGYGDVIDFPCVSGTTKTVETAKERYVLYVRNLGSAAEIRLMGFAILEESRLTDPVASNRVRDLSDKDYARLCRNDHVAEIALGGRMVVSLSILAGDKGPLPPTMTLVANTGQEALTRFGPLVDRYRTDYEFIGSGIGVVDPRGTSSSIEVMTHADGNTPTERVVNFVEKVLKTPRGGIVGTSPLAIETESNPALPKKTWVEKIKARIGM